VDVNVKDEVNDAGMSMDYYLDTDDDFERY